MSYAYLNQLNEIVVSILEIPTVIEKISELKKKVQQSDEPFVWSVIDSGFLSRSLPGNLKSSWIFVLKEGVPSGCHYHPNSIQHMILIEGGGKSKVGGKFKKMISFGSPGYRIEDIWYVIEEGVEHEFFPEGQDMVVISFHTCAANELQEVFCETSRSRVYEKKV